MPQSDFAVRFFFHPQRRSELALTLFVAIKRTEFEHENAILNSKVGDIQLFQDPLYLLSFLTELRSQQEVF